MGVCSHTDLTLPSGHSIHAKSSDSRIKRCVLNPNDYQKCATCTLKDLPGWSRARSVQGTRMHPGKTHWTAYRTLRDHT